MEAKITRWSDDQWVTAYTITTNPDLQVTDQAGRALHPNERSEWLEAQPTMVTRAGKVNAVDDIEGWLEAYSKRSFTYVRILISE